MYITLQENTAYRWNANGEAAKSNEIHLDDTEGMNCSYRFDYVEDNWYGIKHINKNGIDRFVDIEDKSKDDGKVLHLCRRQHSPAGSVPGTGMRHQLSCDIAAETAGCGDVAGEDLFNDGKCRNADLAGVPDSRVSSYGSSTGTSQESVQETHIRDGRLRENAVWIDMNSEIGTQIDFWYILC